jgi:hypothetical protein
MYCDISGKIPNFLNSCLQESLVLDPVIVPRVIREEN